MTDQPQPVSDARQPVSDARAGNPANGPDGNLAGNPDGSLASSPDPSPDGLQTAAFLPEKQGWVARHLTAIDQAGTTEVAQIQERPVIVVTMRGARSGQLRRVPVMRVEHEGSYTAVASKGGAPEHPHWFHNLMAHADVLVQDGQTQHPMRARLLADGAERDAWWERAVAAFPSYADYQQKAGRQIPVFVLEPIA